jgi:polysaccharide deacetylase family protein (PEP-CTERM system associated)
MTPACLDQDVPSAAARLRPFISVIVPIRNEAPFIRRTLDQLLGQNYDPDRFEVIVVDGASTDDTPDVVRSLEAEHPNLRLLANARRWSSAARNLGVRSARGDIVVVVDGHCEVDNANYLSELADAFERSGADCVGRPQPLDVPGASALQRAIAAARASRLGHNPASYIYSAAEQFVPSKSVAIAYRRSVFESVGYFDEGFDACEDVEFNHRIDRAGLRCFFTPRVRVRYYPRASLRGLFHQLRRYGQGRVRLLAKHPDTFTVPCFLPALFVLGVVGGALLSFLTPWLALLYAGIMGLYLLAVLAASASLATQARDVRLLPWLPLVFPTIHCGAGAGILQEALCQLGRRSLPPAQFVPDDQCSPHAEREGPHAEREVYTEGPHAEREVYTGAPPRLALFGQAENYRIKSVTVARSPAPAVPTLLNALTVDVEDYYHVSAFESLIGRHQWNSFESRVVASTQRILDVLADASVRGTFFVLGYVAERHPELVRRIRAAGHEIGCHSYWHRLVYQQTPEEFRADLRRARDVLQDLTGSPVVAYRAPSFSITRRNLWALDVLIEEGFRFDSSIYPTYHDRYGIAGAPSQPHQIVRPTGSLWEFPMAIYRRFGYPLPIGGGGYFRLYPYALTRRGLRAINAEGRPFVVYIHPWELDPEQPRLKAGRLTTFRHYNNLHRTRGRLAQLLRDFPLGTVTDVYASLQAEGAMPRWDLTRAA